VEAIEPVGDSAGVGAAQRDGLGQFLGLGEMSIGGELNAVVDGWSAVDDGGGLEHAGVGGTEGTATVVTPVRTGTAARFRRCTTKVPRPTCAVGVPDWRAVIAWIYSGTEESPSGMTPRHASGEGPSYCRIRARSCTTRQDATGVAPRASTGESKDRVGGGRAAGAERGPVVGSLTLRKWLT
jgi:hypothetical protein